MVPPKDPYIKVRVIDDIGEVALSDQVANLARHAIMFLRRTDAEQYITQVPFCLSFFTFNIGSTISTTSDIVICYPLLPGPNGRAHRLTGAFCF